MRKLTLTLFAALACNVVLSQTSVSVGLTRWSESEWNLDDHLFSLSNNNSFIHNKYFASAIEQRGRHLFEGELSFFKKDLSYFRSESTGSGGGSSPYYGRYENWGAHVKYAYVGVKLGYAYSFEGTSVFNENWKTMLELGGFIGVDVLSAHKETNHFHYIREQNNNNMNQTMVVTYEETSRDEFQAVSMRKLPMYAGVRVARRLYFGEHIFVRAGLAFGWMNHGDVGQVRLQGIGLGQLYENHLFLSTNASIGYTLK